MSGASAASSATIDGALFPGRPAPDEPTRSRRLDSVAVHGTVATATMTLTHGPDTFTNLFLLVRTDTGWHIANKTYHRHPRIPPSGPDQVVGQHAVAVAQMKPARILDQATG